MDYDSAYQAYKNQASNARKKKVPFGITFCEWCDIWAPFIDRRKTLQLQRKDKRAGYVTGNLRIGERARAANSGRKIERKQPSTAHLGIYIEEASCRNK